MEKKTYAGSYDKLDFILLKSVQTLIFKSQASSYSSDALLLQVTDLMDFRYCIQHYLSLIVQVIPNPNNVQIARI